MKYCAHCGQEIVEQIGNRFECPNGHKNWINPAPGAIAFVVQDGKVLFGVRGIAPNPGRLCLPGGFIDPNESAEAATIREIKEELGVDIEILDFLGSYPHDYNDGRPTLNLVFVATPVAGAAVTAGDDMNGGQPVWRDLTDLPVKDELAWSWYEQAYPDLIAWHKAHS